MKLKLTMLTFSFALKALDSHYIVNLPVLHNFEAQLM